MMVEVSGNICICSYDFRDLDIYESVYEGTDIKCYIFI